MEQCTTPLALHCVEQVVEEVGRGGSGLTAPAALSHLLLWVTDHYASILVSNIQLKNSLKERFIE